MVQQVLCIIIFSSIVGSCLHSRSGWADETPETSRRDLIEAEDRTIAKLNAELQDALHASLKALPAINDGDPEAIEQYSKRGDLRMFLGMFSEAESDYRKMVAIQPSMDSSHWRLGIAMYFAGHPDAAAAQFDKYHAFDNIDRENGIWRYLSHREAFGREKALQQLLKYDKDDRPPFREVYKLFEGTMTPAEVLGSVGPDLSESSRASRLFYAHLYIGLNHAVEGEKAAALTSLRASTLNSWPRKAGFGPDYMWHIGRLRYNQLMLDPASR